jgi:hypothetical protein
MVYSENGLALVPNKTRVDWGAAMNVAVAKAELNNSVHLLSL